MYCLEVGKVGNETSLTGGGGATLEGDCEGVGPLADRGGGGSSLGGGGAWKTGLRGRLSFSVFLNGSNTIQCKVPNVL